VPSNQKSGSGNRCVGEQSPIQFEMMEPYDFFKSAAPNKMKNKEQEEEQDE